MSARTEVVWLIEPNGPMSGDVTVQGSKNAVTKHMIATILTQSPSVLENVPAVGDVAITTKILESVGASIELVDQTMSIDASTISSHVVPVEFSGLNRMPVLMIGPLVFRTGKAEVPLLGGDDIGPRPIDFHLETFRAFGIDVRVFADRIVASANGPLRAARIKLPFPSVGATESALLTAVLVPGRSVISNAALEPEVMELARFLQRMGAMISMEPNRRIVVQGVDSLEGARHRLAGDRNEAFSYLVAGAITGGDVSVRGCSQASMMSAITVLQKVGVRLDITDEYLRVLRTPRTELRPVAVETDTHPGLMTDWQAPLVALLTQAQGVSVVHETVYENRFTYVNALKQMGASLQVFPNCLGGAECRFSDLDAPHSALISGPARLHGSDVHVPDVRGGFAYAIAAAAASSGSRLSGAEHMERGYSDPASKLQELGMQIKRTETSHAGDTSPT